MVFAKDLYERNSTTTTVLSPKDTRHLQHCDSYQTFFRLFVDHITHFVDHIGIFRLCVDHITHFMDHVGIFRSQSRAGGLRHGTARAYIYGSFTDLWAISPSLQNSPRNELESVCRKSKYLSTPTNSQAVYLILVPIPTPTTMGDNSLEATVEAAKEPNNFAQRWNEVGDIIASTIPSPGLVKQLDAILSFLHSKPAHGERSRPCVTALLDMSTSTVENQHPQSRLSPPPVSEASPVVSSDIRQSVEGLDFVATSNGGTSLCILCAQPDDMDDNPRRLTPIDTTGLSNEVGATINMLARRNDCVAHGVVTVEARPTASERSSDLCLTIPQSDFISDSTALCSKPDLSSTNKGFNPLPCPNLSAQIPGRSTEVRERGPGSLGSALNPSAFAPRSRQNHCSNENKCSSKASLTPASASAGIVCGYKTPWSASPSGDFLFLGGDRIGGMTVNDLRRKRKALIDGDPVSFFLDYCPYIYGAWLSSLVSTTSSDSLQSLVAAFDSVLSFVRDRKRRCSEISGCLPLRFGYIQLVAAIDAFNAEAKNAGKQMQKCYNMANLPVKAYLEAKGMNPNDQGEQRKLTTLAINARRFRELAALSPIMLSIYSMEAEEIVYVTLPEFLYISA